jgi:hypothetical protein
MNFKDTLSNLLRSDEGGKTGNIIQIQDNLYKFDVFLWNGETRTGITFGSIEEFQIVDDLRHIYSYGYIIFSDNQDVFESFEGIEGKSKVKPYNFRGDGRDYLEVEIMPQVNEVCVGSTPQRDAKEFSLKHTFSVYKIEEDVREDKGVKFKKLYFWDVDYQHLTEIDSKFSTSEVRLKSENILGSLRLNINNKKSKNTDDFRRYTGDSIKYLLDKCLNKTSTSGFKASKEWDTGGSMVEYHTNGQYKAIDDLQYLMEYHVSEKSYGYVPCILKKMRYTEEYSFVPITAYLQNSFYKGNNFLGLVGGRNLTEDLYIGKLDTAGRGLGGKMNFGVNPSPNSFNAINYNLIETYSFLKPDADMIQKDISTHFVHSYDPRGFFSCSIKANNFATSTKTIYDQNIKNIPNFNKSRGYDIIPKNQLRENNKNVQHVFASGISIENRIPEYNFGRNKALMASVFKNSAIYFRVRGLTRRKSGTLFNVNRLDNQKTSDYDNIVLGTYFTTMVIHEFKKGMYYNHIYATKPSISKKHEFAKMI